MCDKRAVSEASLKRNIKIEVLCKQLQFLCNPYCNSSCLLCRSGNADPKIYMKMQETHNSQHDIAKEELVKRLTHASSKTYCKAIIIKTV